MSTSELRAFYSGRINWRHAGQERMRFRVAAALAQVEPGHDVLDIGSRDGDLRAYLPAGATYLGMDIAPEFAAPHVITHDASLGLPFYEETFDRVFLIECLEHTRTPYQVLSEVHRILRPLGRAIVSVPNPYHIKEILWNLFRVPDRQGHLFSWTRQTMTRLAQMTGFRLTGWRGTYFVPPVPAPGLLARSLVYRLEKV
jgi:SAM-dependent methyltransferase